MKINQLTSTRFIAALAIIIYHYGAHAFPFKYFPGIFNQAFIGVSYFFVLSGFVMMVAYSGKTINYINFIKNRFARIYPLYLFALIFLFMVWYPKALDMPDVALNLLLIQTWFFEKAQTLNYPGWSLSVELLFYILFPFLFRFYKKYSLERIFIYVILFWLISQAVFGLFLLYASNDVADYVFYLPVMHLNEFLLGNIAGLFYVLKSSPKKTDLRILALICLIVLALLFPFNINYANGILAILFAPLIVAISGNTGVITKILEKKWFVFLGEISYGIYILQYPVCLWINDDRIEKYLHIAKESSLNFYVKLLVLILISGISYFLIEKPLRKIIQKIRLGKRPSPLIL